VGYLSEIGVFQNQEEESSEVSKRSSVLLKHCPQLFRLRSEAVQETAQWLVETFGLSYLRQAVLTDSTKEDNQAILLSFRKDDAEYGLTFLSRMMMGNAKPVCEASSSFFVQGIQGGIQERFVSAALGDAGQATSKASKSIASDTMASFRQLKDSNRRKR